MDKYTQEELFLLLTKEKPETVERKGEVFLGKGMFLHSGTIDRSTGDIKDVRETFLN